MRPYLIRMDAPRAPSMRVTLPWCCLTTLIMKKVLLRDDVMGVVYQ